MGLKVKCDRVFDALIKEQLTFSLFSTCIFVFMLYRAVQHPRVPESQDFVRVHSYQSKMVIRPHKSFDEVRVECLTTINKSFSRVPCFVDTEFDFVFFFTEWI